MTASVYSPINLSAKARRSADSISLIDLRFSEEETAQLSSGSRGQMEKYSYREEHSRLYVLRGDDAGLVFSLIGWTLINAGGSDVARRRAIRKISCGS